MVRPGRFERPTFCSGGSRPRYEPITYSPDRPPSPSDFPDVSSAFREYWWGIWWGIRGAEISFQSRVRCACSDRFEIKTTLINDGKPTPRDVVPKREWTDHEDRLGAEWLQKQGILVSAEVAGQAVQTAARDHSIHPVKAHLQALKWDGVQRLDTWLSAYLGAECTEYARAVGSRWLISAVARIFRPGAKADCCLILEGPQGIRKSTALRTLAGEFFTDELADLGSKDAAMQTRGVWIIELSELDSLSNSDVARIKAFMSRTTDRFRPPYGMRLVESPRQCVFAGTVNQSVYLKHRRNNYFTVEGLIV